MLNGVQSILHVEQLEPLALKQCIDTIGMNISLSVHHTDFTLIASYTFYI